MNTSEKTLTQDDKETTWVKFDGQEEMGEEFRQAVLGIYNRQRKIHSVKIVRSNGLFGFFRKVLGVVITHTGE
ncbi:hypothetical protein ACEN2T_17350 [Pseudomonas sp. W22_MBD1_FP4]|uniref:hypothetical protein n=1 Tax=Pseudomonas sp. W22_MBD1_FP4 TaxID=3240272 RepID=UPI003F996B8E